MDTPANDYKQHITDVIKKQMVILGPEITLSKVRNIAGLTVEEDGTVTNIQGNGQEMLQKIANQFIELSGDIVKGAMESILTESQEKPTVELPAAPIQPPPMQQSTPAQVEQTPGIPQMVTPTTQPMPLTAEQTPVSPVSPMSGGQMPMPTPVPMPIATTTAEISQPMPSSPSPTLATAAPAPMAMPQQPQPTMPTQPAASEQTDPDMQHIINEALKQTK